MKLNQRISALLIPLLIAGCTTVDTRSNGSQSSLIKTSSTSSIIQTKEAEFAQLYQANKHKNGTQNAINSVKSGIRAVKIIYAGRGSSHIPAFERAPKNCELDAVDGMGDVIYGENHMKYRKLMRTYAKDYNQVMVAYCK